MSHLRVSRQQQVSHSVGKGVTSPCPSGVAPMGFLIPGFSYKEIVRKRITLFTTVLESRWQENISPFAHKQGIWSACVRAAVMFDLCVPKQTFLSRLQLFSRPTLLCLQPCACSFGSLCDFGSRWRCLITLRFAGFVVIVCLMNFVVRGFLRISRDLTWWPYQKGGTWHASIALPFFLADWSVTMCFCPWDSKSGGEQGKGNMPWWWRWRRW